jgi:hypothetical protein
VALLPEVLGIADQSLLFERLLPQGLKPVIF